FPRLLVHKGLVAHGGQQAQGRHVARLGRPILDRLPGSLLLLGADQHLIHVLKRHLGDLGRDPERMVVTQLGLGPYIHLGGKAEWLLRINLIRLGRVDIGVTEWLQVIVLNRLGVGIIHADVCRLAQQCLGPNGPLQHGARRLAGSEAGHAVAPSQFLVGLVHGPTQHFRIYFYLELHLALGQMLYFNPHGRPTSLAKLWENMSMVGERLWGRRDSNPHALLHMILSHARLPIPTLPPTLDRIAYTDARAEEKRRGRLSPFSHDMHSLSVVSN